MKLSQKVESMHLSPIRKFYPYADKAKAMGKKVYGLNIGQPDIETPREFFDAVNNYNADVLAYAPSNGLPILAEAISGYYRRIGVMFEPEEIIITNGGSEALEMIFNSIIDDGDEVVMAEPFYTNYDSFVKQAGGKLVPIKCTADDGYHYAERAKIEAAITDKTKAIAIINPGNPTGVVLTKEEMRLIADIAKEHDLFLICDEVYREFVYDGLEMSSFAEFDDIDENLILVDSVSKRFSACGARCGSIATHNKDLFVAFVKFCQARLCTATLEQVGSAALYNMDPSYFHDIKKEYENRRNVSYAALQEIEGIKCAKPQGAFYITCQLPVDDAEEFLIWMLENFDIDGETTMFAPAGGFFGTPGVGKSDIRIAYVLKAEEMQKGINIIKEAIKAYNAR
ncbi:MAG: pyridoxal phosphate-dependent aminotransferase [Clostridia bacterium]|nr:pyridoxal phosphate-dependent aminotransferase [Clostridia bacterium]